MNAIITRTDLALPLGSYPATFSYSTSQMEILVTRQHVGGSRSLPSYPII